ncbi:MAG: T9SS type A sorting domain-containing protein, partial [Bacteroidetes bacterium]|nr:T9SS type A sorting domain-containing protein [Bacteroidota bacterium]
EPLGRVRRVAVDKHGNKWLTTQDDSGNRIFAFRQGGVVGVSNERESMSDSDQAAPDIYPNPFRDTASLVVSVPTAGPVRAELFDLIGRRISVIIDRWEPAGSLFLSIHAENLMAGTYVVRVTTPVGVVNKTIAVVR